MPGTPSVFLLPPNILMISVKASRRVVTLNPAFALGTDAAGQLMEDVVGVLFDPDFAFSAGLTKWPPFTRG